MTTITKLEQQFKEGKPSGYKVNLADGSWGYLVEKDSDKGLKEGDTVNYSAETPNGKSYKKLTIHKEGGSQSAPPSQSQSGSTINQAKFPLQSFKSVQELKVEASIRALEFTIGAFTSEKIDDKQIADFQKRATIILWNDIDEIFSETNKG